MEEIMGGTPMPRRKNEPAGVDGCEKTNVTTAIRRRAFIERRPQSERRPDLVTAYRRSTVLLVCSLVTVTSPAGLSFTTSFRWLTLPAESECVVVFSATVRSQATRPIGKDNAKAANIE